LYPLPPPEGDYDRARSGASALVFLPCLDPCLVLQELRGDADEPNPFSADARRDESGLEALAPSRGSFFFSLLA